MWLLPVTRRDLVDLITPRRGATAPNAVEEKRPNFDAVRPDMLAAIWPSSPAEFGVLPTAIVVPEGTRRDTLAWLSTYVRDFRPFTAYCRVVERPIAELFLKGPSSPTLMGVEGICAGLVLGESLTYGRGRPATLDLPITAYSATLSYAISRTLTLTGGTFPLDTIVRQWTIARDLTGQNDAVIPPGPILSIWAIALGATTPASTLFGHPDILGAAWAELNSLGEISDPVWNALVEGFPDLGKFRVVADLPREQRVSIVDTALRILATSKRGDEDRRGFLAGYITSLLAPGTLSHADFLATIAPVLPTAYLWYGLFAGVNPRGDALPAGNPLARRITRDLTVPDRLVDRPRCDVAIEELAMHVGAENLIRQTAKAGRLDIDILPGVTTSLRWPPHDDAMEDERRRVRDLETIHLLTEMDSVSAHWNHLIERFRDLVRTNPATPPQVPKKKKGNKP